MKKRNLWIKILTLEGALLVGLGFGWALGTRAGPSLRAPIFLVGLGLIGILTSIVLWKSFSRSHSGPQVRNSLAPIDLADNDKALRTHGVQPPLIEDEGLLVTEYRLIEPGQRWTDMKPPYVVHHWKGEGALRAEIGQLSTLLEVGQILRVSPNEAGDKGNLSIHGNSGNAAVLVHFLSSDDPLV